MANERNALKAGAFMVVCVVLMIAVIVGIRGIATWARPMELRAVAFKLTDDVGGLQIGDDVRIGGYKVGTVQDIEVIGADTAAANEEPARIRVVFSFPKKYSIRRDAVLRIQGTLTGTSWLNFENLGSGQAVPAGEEMAGRPSTMGELLASIAKLGPPLTGVLNTVEQKTLPAVNDTFAKFGRTADTFTETGQSATKLIGDVREKLGPMAEKYHKVVDIAVETLARIRDLFGDVNPDIRVTIANLKDATGSLKQSMPGLLERAQSILVRLEKGVDSATVALEDIKATAANAKDATASIRALLVGNRGKFDAMIASLKATGDNLKGASSEIRHSPWRLLYKPSAGEMANLNLFDATREFADGAAELNDAAAALRDALQNKQEDPEHVRKLMDNVNHAFENFRGVEKKLWTKVQD